MYVKDTLDGIVKQQTNFPFLVILVDDASTDGQQCLISEYISNHFNQFSVHQVDNQDAHIVFSQHKSNNNCYILSILLKYNHYSINKSKLEYYKDWITNCKYEASCEGDDYWIDSRKLQKQVNYMEEHSGCVLTCHRVHKYYQKEKKLVSNDGNDRYFLDNSGIKFTNEFNYKVLWMTQTLCTMYRMCFSKEFLEYPYEKTDGSRAYFYLKHGYGYCFNEYMAVYRVNDSGVWSRLTRREQYYSNFTLYNNLCQYENNKLTRFLRDKGYLYLFRETKGGCIFEYGITFTQLALILYSYMLNFVTKIKRCISNSF